MANPQRENGHTDIAHEVLEQAGIVCDQHRHHVAQPLAVRPLAAAGGADDVVAELVMHDRRIGRVRPVERRLAEVERVATGRAAIKSGYSLARR